MKSFITISIMLIVIPGISQQYEYKPLDESRIHYIDGEIFIVSDTTESTVLLGVSRSKREEITLNIELLNNSEKVHFFPSHVKLISIAGDGSKVEHKIVTSDEYMEKVENRMKWRRVLIAISQGLEESTAGNSYSNTTTSGSINSTNYQDNYNYSSASVTSSYDRSKVLETKSRNRKEMSNRIREDQQSYSNIESTLMRAQTLEKGQFYSGFIKVRLEREDLEAAALIIEIPIGEITHKFFLINKYYFD